MAITKAKSQTAPEGIVLLTMIITGATLFKRSPNYTTKQNIGHATGLLIVTVGLIFLADAGAGTIAAGLAILVFFAVQYKEKPGSAGTGGALGGSTATGAGAGVAGGGGGAN